MQHNETSHLQMIRKRVRAQSGERRAVKAKLIRQPKPKVLLGSKVNTLLKYVHYGSLNPGTLGVPASYVFSANGLYDPDVTGAGHQPRGFDQLIQLYDHYVVRKSTIKVTFLAHSSNECNVCGIILQDDSSVSSTDLITELESRNTTYGGLAYGNGSIMRKLDFNAKSFFNINDRLMYGTSSSNPSDQAYFVVFVQPTDTIDNNPVRIMVELIYDCEFSEPNNVGSS